MLASGITRCVVNGTCPEDWPKVAELAAQYSDFIIPSFGMHPWKKPTADWKSQLIHFLDTTPNACLGECGLDRWMKGYNLDLQRKVFTTQLDIAVKRNLPLSIHCLKAWGPLIEILEMHQTPERGFLLHSYGGSAELVPRLSQLGSYFSFSGYFLHPRKSNVLNAFQKVPPDRLLMETDAPDMLPPESVITHPLDNNLNHPANLAAITVKAAESMDTSLVVQNFNRFFTA